MIAELSTRVNRELELLVDELSEGSPGRSTEVPHATSPSDAREQQRLIRRRIQYLQRVSAGLTMVEPVTLSRGAIGFGSTVRVQDLRTRDTLEYTLMTGDALDIDAGEVSLASPVGQALLGCREGEEVEVITPHGRRRLKVVRVTTLFDRLEADAAAVIGQA